MSDLPPTALIIAIREKLCEAQGARDAAEAAVSLDVEDGHLATYDQATEALLILMGHAEMAGLLAEIQSFVATVYGGPEA